MRTVVEKQFTDMEIGMVGCIVALNGIENNLSAIREEIARQLAGTWMKNLDPCQIEIVLPEYDPVGGFQQLVLIIHHPEFLYGRIRRWVDFVPYEDKQVCGIRLLGMRE